MKIPIAILYSRLDHNGLNLCKTVCMDEDSCYSASVCSVSIDLSDHCTHAFGDHDLRVGVPTELVSEPS